MTLGGTLVTLGGSLCDLEVMWSSWVTLGGGGHFGDLGGLFV